MKIFKNRDVGKSKPKEGPLTGRRAQHDGDAAEDHGLDEAVDVCGGERHGAEGTGREGRRAG